MTRTVGIGLIVFFAFLVGCATSALVNSMAVPPAHAAVNVVRWEYLVIPSSDNGLHALNHYGAQGWEAVLEFERTVLLKRPLQSTVAQSPQVAPPPNQPPAPWQ
jgi:hypothetical protein